VATGIAMAFLFELVLFVAAGVAAGYVWARYFRAATGPEEYDQGRRLHDLMVERDRLCTELDELRREPASKEVADARVDHLKSAIHAAKRRIAELEEELAEARRMLAAVAKHHAAAQKSTGTPPERLREPDGPADDLKRIAGVGPGIERKLNETGIYHFRQIAMLSEANVTWLDQHLQLRGRIERQDWIVQARELAGAAPEPAVAAELAPAL
jgi:predicted flap endonuclease-1-like 5' DNA nuclease